MLIVLGGLPGVGKTSIARVLAETLPAVHVRIDSIEQALRNAGVDVHSEGYVVAHSVAADNLRLGQVVIADCVNLWTLTRDAWRAVAAREGAAVLNVEVVCSDVAEHKRRVDSRRPDIDGHSLPTWTQVSAHDYQPWTTERLIVDTARLAVGESVTLISSAVSRLRGVQR